MPKIPTRDRDSVIAKGFIQEQTDNRFVGAAEREFGKIGDQLLSMGADLIEKRERSKAADYASNEMFRLQREFNIFQNDLKTKVDENATGYSDKIGEWLKRRKEDSLAKAPNQMGTEKFKQAFGMFESNSLIGADNYMNKASHDNYVFSMEKEANEFRRHLVELPDRTTTMTAIEGISLKGAEGVDIGHYSKAQGEQYTLKLVNGIAKSYFDGLDNNEDLWEVGLADIKDPEGPAKFLTPDQKDHFIEKFQKKIKQKQEFNVGEARRVLKDAEVSLELGLDVDTDSMSRALVSLKNNPSAQKDLAPRLERRLTLAKQIGENLNTLRETPLDKWKEIPVPEVGGKFATDEFSFSTKYLKRRSDLFKQAKADPLGYRISSNDKLRSKFIQAEDSTLQGPEKFRILRDAVDSAIIDQKNYGFADHEIRVTTEGMRSSILNDFAGNDPVTIRDTIDSYRAQYGKHFNKLYSEVMGSAKNETEKAKLQSFYVAGYIDDPAVKTRVIQNGINAKDIKREYGEKFGQGKSIDKLVSSNKTFQQYTRTFSSNHPMINSLNEAISIEIQKKLSAGDQLSGKGFFSTSIVDQTVKEILEDNYLVVDEANSNFVLPKMSGGQKVSEENIKAFVEAHSDKEGLAALGITKEYKDLGNLKWQASKSMETIVLTGNIKGVDIIITDDNGDPVEKEIFEISDNPSKRTLEFASKEREGFSTFFTNYLKEATKADNELIKDFNLRQKAGRDE